MGRIYGAAFVPHLEKPQPKTLLCTSILATMSVPAENDEIRFGSPH
jgi:hypothetical protein